MRISIRISKHISQKFKLGEHFFSIVTEHHLFVNDHDVYVSESSKILSKKRTLNLLWLDVAISVKRFKTNIFIQLSTLFCRGTFNHKCLLLISHGTDH